MCTINYRVLLVSKKNYIGSIIFLFLAMKQNTVVRFQNVMTGTVIMYVILFQTCN